MYDLASDALLDNAESLRGMIVLITGGAAGFGKSTALLAAQYGAKVVIADLKPRFTQETVGEIRKAGGTCSAPAGAVNVTDPISLREAFEHCLEKYGGVPNVVIANAGVNLNDHFEEDGEIPESSKRPAYPSPPRDLTLAVNLKGAVSTCEIAQEYWNSHPAAPGEGTKRRLIVLSSMGGQTAIPAGTTYSTSKHGVLGYWKSVCQELEEQGEAPGFQFYAICPFFANTRIFNPAMLLVLAGIPLVPVKLIAKTMLHVASRPPLSGASGAVVLLPDHGDPAMALPTEYEPLSLQWTQTMNARCAKTDAWAQVPAWKRIWNDVARNYYGVSGPILALRAAGMLGAVVLFGVGVSQMSNLVPPWAALGFGTLLGLSGRYARKSGRDKQSAQRMQST